MAQSQDTAAGLESVVSVGLEHYLKEKMKTVLAPIRDQAIKEIDNQIEKIIEDSCKQLQITINTHRDFETLHDKVLIRWINDTNSSAKD